MIIKKKIETGVKLRVMRPYELNHIIEIENVIECLQE